MKQDKDPAKHKKIRRIIIIVCVAAAIILLALVIFLNRAQLSKKPVLSIQTPQEKISVSHKESFTLDMSISDMGDALYPAASFCINFDPSKLEFLGVEEGNVLIHDDINEAGVAQKLPDWSFNTEKSNETGQINIIYLDITGGKYAFSKDLLSSEEHVILRLSFRLRGSAKAGDAYELSFADAVFAASDSTKSLAMTQDTLITQSGKIVVGEK